MSRDRQRSLVLVAAVGAVALLASRAAAWLTPEPPAIHRNEPRPLPPAPGGAFAVREGPGLSLVHEERPRVRVEHLRRCTKGDALLTIERSTDEATWLVVRRAGVRCFRLRFAGAGEGPPQLQLHGTIDAHGEAGPLAVVWNRAHGAEIRLLALSLDGRLLLDRSLAVDEADADEGSLSLVPLLWDGERLLVWSTTRAWGGSERSCSGALLGIAPRGPVAVAAGFPCDPAGAADVDGDGRMELLAATHVADDGTRWEAAVALEGDLLATRVGAPAVARLSGARPALLVPPASALEGTALVPWPWEGPQLDLPPDEGARLAWDWDGDGADELILGGRGEATIYDQAGRRLAVVPGAPLAGRADGERRELLVEDFVCGIAAVDRRGERRCAPGDLQQLERLVSVGGAFDWTGDGTADVTAVGIDPQGGLLLAAWAEGDLAFSWAAETLEELPPRHQAPRALSLTAASAAEVLVATPEGFAVRSIPDGAVRWEGRAEEGILDAWAVPATGPSAAAVR